MTKLKRRALLLSWVVLGPIPTAYMWRIMYDALLRVLQDVAFSGVVAMYSSVISFCIIGYSISEIKVLDK